MFTDRTFSDGKSDPYLHGKRIEDLVNDPNFYKYFGETMWSNEQEGLMWLTTRENGRPVLLMANGDTTYAKEVLGFKTITLWTNPVQVKYTAMEAMIQHNIRHQPLGQRLHRIEGAGPDGTKQIDFEHQIHHTAIMRL